MFAVIKRFLGGLFSRKQIEPPPRPPQDPFAFQPVSRKPSPNDRSGAVAVLEPDDGEESAEPAVMPDTRDDCADRESLTRVRLVEENW